MTVSEHEAAAAREQAAATAHRGQYDPASEATAVRTALGRRASAPARRVGFFWHRPAAVTPAGRRLFEAAVDWLLR